MVRRTFRPIGSDVAVRAGEDSRPETSCFADEVVIDFPSPARAIDRIRRAFMSDERAAMAADLHLSAREGRDGATVPLGVPVRCTCRTCGGRGETWTECCAGCGGTGVEVLRHPVEVSVPPGTCDGDRFHFSISARHDLTTRIELRVCIA
jgi:hypothetical protein